MFTNITKIKVRAKQNIGEVCDALLADYDRTVLSGTVGADRFNLVRNCEDLLYHAGEMNEAPLWDVEGVDVISGHHDQVLHRLKDELKNPTIVFACEFVQKLLESYNQAIMEKLSKEKMPVLIFDKLVWWTPGPLFTFEPPFGLKKFSEDPNVLEKIVKTKDSMGGGDGGQQRLEEMAEKMKKKAGAEEGKDYIIKRSSLGKIDSVTSFRPQNKGGWTKQCKAFYANAANSVDNPFQCEALPTPSYFLASLAEGLSGKFAGGSVNSGLWLVKEESDRFSLHQIDAKGKENGLTVDIDVIKS